MKKAVQQDSSPATKISLKDLLEIIGKAAAGLSAVCYVLGFFVVNIYSSSFGYHSVGLLSAQYLTAGVWALIPMAGGWFFVLNTLREDVFLVLKPAGILVLVVGTALSFLLLALSGDWLAGLSPVSRWLIVGFAGFFISIPTAAFFWWLSPVESLTGNWIPLTVLLAFFASLLAVVYLSTFARSLYGDIPGTLGGGRPRVVRLVVKPDLKEDLAAVGISFTEGSHITDSLRLLTATDREYIVLTAREKSSLSIRSDGIQAVLYEGR